jgi:hypothetical protein
MKEMEAKWPQFSGPKFLQFYNKMENWKMLACKYNGIPMV